MLEGDFGERRRKVIGNRRITFAHQKAFPKFTSSFIHPSQPPEDNAKPEVEKRSRRKLFSKAKNTKEIKSLCVLFVFALKIT